MKLHHAPGAASSPVVVLCKEIGLGVDTVRWDSENILAMRQYEKISPIEDFPALEDGSTVIFSPLQVVDYLFESRVSHLMLSRWRVAKTDKDRRLYQYVGELSLELLGLVNTLERGVSGKEVSLDSLLQSLDIEARNPMKRGAPAHRKLREVKVSHATLERLMMRAYRILILLESYMGHTEYALPRGRSALDCFVGYASWRAYQLLFRNLNLRHLRLYLRNLISREAWRGVTKDHARYTADIIKELNAV